MNQFIRQVSCELNFEKTKFNESLEKFIPELKILTLGFSSFSNHYFILFLRNTQKKLKEKIIFP